MIVKKIPMKEYLEKFPMTDKTSRAITTYGEGDEPVVYTPKSISTRTRLHELYHTTGPEEGRSWESHEGVALEELGAEKFASDKLGKKLSGNSVGYVSAVLFEDGMTSAGVYRVLSKALKKLGYKMTYEYRTWLRKAIEEQEKTYY